MLDKSYGRYLHEHILAGYAFLTTHYVVGDHIHLFGLSSPHYNPVAKLLILFPGFSRGAYIARALAGLLHKVGTTYNSSVLNVDLFGCVGWPAQEIFRATNTRRI